MGIRQICVVSGSRAEYGLLRPVLLALSRHPRFKKQLLVTGSHADPRYGLTRREIERDFKIDAFIPWRYRSDTLENRVWEIAEGCRSAGRELVRLRPHGVLLLGDRPDILPVAIASAVLGVPVAHLHGGDVSGTFLDNAFRSAIAAFARLHLAATPKGARKLVASGIGADRVVVTGAPGIDAIRLAPQLTPAEVRARLNLPARERYLVVLQHPVLGQEKEAGRQIRRTLAAVRKNRLPAVVVYPNADPGSVAVIAAIRAAARSSFILRPSSLQFRVFRNLPHDLFVNALRHAAALVGNSSAGIIEAPFLKLPAVNIGSRQDGRERSTNVLDVPHEATRIEAAIHRALYDLSFLRRVQRCVNPYGDGHAAERTVRAIDRFL